MNKNKKFFHHEGHEVHEAIEDGKAPKNDPLKFAPRVYFVSFVLFVVAKSFEKHCHPMGQWE